MAEVIQLAELIQPSVQVFYEVSHCAPDFDKPGCGCAVISLPIHARLAQKRATHADVDCGFLLGKGSWGQFLVVHCFSLGSNGGESEGKRYICALIVVLNFRLSAKLDDKFRTDRLWI